MRKKRRKAVPPRTAETVARVPNVAPPREVLSPRQANRKIVGTGGFEPLSLRHSVYSATDSPELPYSVPECKNPLMVDQEGVFVVD